MKKQVIGCILGGLLQISGVQASAFFSNAYDGSGNRIARSGSGALLLTNDSSNLSQIIRAASSPQIWAFDQRKGSVNGTLGYQYQLPGTSTNTGVSINALTVDANQVAAVAGSIATKGYLMVNKLLVNGYPDLSYYFTCDPKTILGYTTFTEQQLTSLVSDGAGGYFASGYITDTTNGYGVIVHVNGSAALTVPFGMDGVYVPAGFAYARSIATQSTGALVYAGTTVYGAGNLIVGRALSSGVVDSSFTIYNATSTGINGSTVSIAVDSQDRIIVAGTTTAPNIVVARFNANGGLDTTFNGTGIKTVAAGTGNAVRVLSDNSIIVAGADTTSPTKALVAKLTSAGALDTSFGSGGTGIVTQSFAVAACAIRALSILPSGDIAAGGTQGTAPMALDAAMLLTSGGLLVNSFFSVGYVTFSGSGGAVTSIGCVQNGAPGLILAGSQADGSSLARFSYFAQP